MPDPEDEVRDEALLADQLYDQWREIKRQVLERSARVGAWPDNWQDLEQSYYRKGGGSAGQQRMLLEYPWLNDLLAVRKQIKRAAGEYARKYPVVTRYYPDTFPSVTDVDVPDSLRDLSADAATGTQGTDTGASTQPVTSAATGTATTGTKYNAKATKAAYWPGFGKYETWASEYARVHGGKRPGEAPTEDWHQAVANLWWSQDFAAKNGRPPTEEEWIAHYWKPGEMGDDGSYLARARELFPDGLASLLAPAGAGAAGAEAPGAELPSGAGAASAVRAQEEAVDTRRFPETVAPNEWRLWSGRFGPELSQDVARGLETGQWYPETMQALQGFHQRYAADVPLPDFIRGLRSSYGGEVGAPPVSQFGLIEPELYEGLTDVGVPGERRGIFETDPYAPAPPVAPPAETEAAPQRGPYWYAPPPRRFYWDAPPPDRAASPVRAQEGAVGTQRFPGQPQDVPSGESMTPAAAGWLAQLQRFFPGRDYGARAAPFQDIVAQAARQYGLTPAFLNAIIAQESGFQPRIASPAGAQGLMQLMPGTARGLGVTDPFDPRQNVMGGARYIADQLGRFGDVGLALAAYNAGPGNVQRYGGIPPFEETQRYVRSLLGPGYQPSGERTQAASAPEPAQPERRGAVSPQELLAMMRSGAFAGF